MSITQALSSGFRSSANMFRVLVVLYLANFLLAALVTVGFKTAIDWALGNSMAVEKLLEGFDYTVYSDLALGQHHVLAPVIAQVVWFALFSMVLNVFFAGGVIASVEGQSFSFASFFESCGAYISRFFRLFLIFGILLVLVSFVMFFVLGILHSSLTENDVTEVPSIKLTIAFVFVFFIPVLIVLMMSDYAKIVTVLDDRKSMLKTAWQSMGFVVRHFLSTFGLQLSLVVISVVLIAGYWLLSDHLTMISGWGIFAGFVFQQVFVAARVWTRILTFASELDLYRTKSEVHEAQETLAFAPTQSPEPQPQPQPRPQPQLHPIVSAAKKPRPRKPAQRRPASRGTSRAKKRK
ncbi:MAG: hypothetical protein WBD36_01320 [Bacteroidota bacterium]